MASKKACTITLSFHEENDTTIVHTSIPSVYYQVMKEMVEVGEIKSIETFLCNSFMHSIESVIDSVDWLAAIVTGHRVRWRNMLQNSPESDLGDN